MLRTLPVFLLCALTSIAGAESINVAAAISLKEALTDVAIKYEHDTGNHVDLVFGSSGQLLAQIKNGAPVDLFISAAIQQIEHLDKSGLADGSKSRVIAGNRLVLIIPSHENAPANFKDLADPSVKKLAIGNPATVPAGQYAQQVLKSLHLDATLADRTIYGANVRQVLDYVARSEVSAGIVYATDAKLAADKIKIVASADESTHDPIRYPAVVLKTSNKSAAAASFLDYLTSKNVKMIFTEKGFTSGDDQPASAAKK